MPERKLLDLINEATRKLTEKGVDAPRINAERMACRLTEMSRVELYTEPNRLVTSDIVDEFDELLTRRLNDEPLQYILGETEFYGIRIKCDPRALIPRPETELVVSEAIEILQDLDRLYILDLACGTGCIGIAFAINLPQASISATDVSANALALARENVALHGLQSRFGLFSGDMFAAVEDDKHPYDAIVCNPPYIAETDFDDLAPQIRKFEPTDALISGPGGLDFVRRMLEEAPRYLVPGGHLIFEIGLGQAESVRALIDTDNDLELIRTVKDYSDMERVVICRKKVRL